MFQAMGNGVVRTAAAAVGIAAAPVAKTQVAHAAPHNSDRFAQVSTPTKTLNMEQATACFKEFACDALKDGKALASSLTGANSFVDQIVGAIQDVTSAGGPNGSMAQNNLSPTKQFANVDTKIGGTTPTPGIDMAPTPLPVA